MSKRYIALDVGEKRIGVAAGDDSVRIAVPLGYIDVDGSELAKVAEYILREDAEVVVIGYPRNQAGEPTLQTQYVEEFAARLSVDITKNIIFQDESLTSVLAEDSLKQTGKAYAKGDIDAQAAALILQDFLEEHA